MSAARRNQRWIWVGRIVFGIVIAGLIAYFMVIGLEKADKLASVLAFLLASGALVGPFLLPKSELSGGGQDSDSDLAARQLKDSDAPVDMRNSHGVQVNQGGTNTQNNNFFGSL
ncbi:hypothetical protein ACBR40_10130 [Nonomuraea sp. AD125B]|uniref:hypothetical protein n=1 Tax=Nonomuraea sp. AD125B TaxID=3242897 RepID=UPI003529B851